MPDIQKSLPSFSRKAGGGVFAERLRMMGDVDQENVTKTPVQKIFSNPLDIMKKMWYYIEAGEDSAYLLLEIVTKNPIQKIKACEYEH